MTPDKLFQNMFQKKTLKLIFQIDPDPAGQAGEGARVHSHRREGSTQEEGVCHAGRKE